MKIKEIVKKVVLWNAQMQVEAKEKRDEKRDEKKRIREMHESFNCPYCYAYHTRKYYYDHKTREEDIKEERQYNNVYFNFIDCRSCGELMGVRATYLSGIGVGLSTNSFKLRDKEKIKENKDG